MVWQWFPSVLLMIISVGVDELIAEVGNLTFARRYLMV
jgi:hypothetical protein